MELIVWTISGIFASAGAYLTLSRHPDWVGKLNGLLAPAIWVVGIAGVCSWATLAGRSLGAEEMHPAYYGIFFITLPAFGGGLGFILGRDAEDKRMQAVFTSVRKRHDLLHADEQPFDPYRTAGSTKQGRSSS